MSNSVLTPGIPSGAYPERAEPRDKFLDKMWGRVSRLATRSIRARRSRVDGFVRLAEHHGESLDRLTSSGIDIELRELRVALKQSGFADDVAARAFALVRHVAERTVKQRHYDVQIVGGWALLHCMVAEMETGEGKTLTATLAASTAALAGLPVHIVTVNDYLAKRDAAWMGPIYEGLGLSVGIIVSGMDLGDKQAAYAKDVVYCTNKEIAFDYLRDRILLKEKPNRLHLQIEGLTGAMTRAERLLLRGLQFAIVDEADSVLIDEARTPLIISRPRSSEQERKAYDTALSMTDKLQAGRHFKINRQERHVELTGAGKGKLDELGRSLGSVWTRRKHREEMILQALSAKHLFALDRHYMVRDGQVQIIDEYTGRAMPDRSWEHGLHQAIEAKEGCGITSQNQPVARISYQRFFRRYHRLAGMTGTAREVAGELGSVYGLSVFRVPTNRPLKRTQLPDQIVRTSAERWTLVVKRVSELHHAGRPVLVGTRSVEASDHISFLLMEAGLPHQVLNARQDEEEADIIARAGEPGRVTVATNMAGRGTDIVLKEGVDKLDGLHVIATERHDARRIDRQLFGRCGRQGDPGSFEAIVCLEDELVTDNVPKLKRWLAGSDDSEKPLGQRAANWILRSAQRSAERQHRHARNDLLRMEEHLEKTLAFSGMAE
jgi:preprotein translocase subunit SecA